ncbi:hypothetical protein TNIN_165191 [Trichonephila inaurata madagascariensis]|uniref:Uncharacterized protein n=1 Tax=Trichonephila inaurata madagascariensis TaxID=2747483 RepID=A0A8X6XBW9_9ARAC|nr:hypothetical protein TNIN_165191 [Trichonephila inaurata madagascariensis]
MLILGSPGASKIDMNWEDTEVRVEEMEWEPSYIQDEAAPPVLKKVSQSPNLTSLQKKSSPPQSKKISVSIEPKPNPLLQVKVKIPTPQKVSPFTSEFILHKIRSKPKVSLPEVSAPNNRVILKARRPSLPKI